MEHRRKRSSHKVRHTFSVSRDVVEVIDRVRERQKLRSRSAALESIIREQQSAERRHAVSQSITDFYNDLTEEERAEERAWGAFSVTQWSKRKE